MAANLASKFSNKVDEKFSKESQALMGTSGEYEFTGVDTVKVYSLNTVSMNNYNREGTNRYGSVTELGDTVQDMKLTRDRSFTFSIDKGNKIQSQMVRDAGKALARQQREVIIPELDSYIYGVWKATAVENGNTDATEATASNAYELLLRGQEKLGDAMVPDQGRIAYCTYKFANLLKRDPAFMKYSQLSQEMVIKGVLGEVDGTKIVKVPKSRLPEGCEFILVHPVATVAPKQLEDYRIHDNPPGLNGWLVEGRIIYDAFVLNNKKAAIYYHGTAE